MDLSAVLCLFESQREHLLARDAQRFARLLTRADPRRFDRTRFERDLQHALQRGENRRRLLPQQIDYPSELPVVQARQQLLDTIRDNQVVVVCGETGSGKTTQLPKLCLELGRGARGLVGHTQPRRLAARSVANRIAQELGGRIGDTVGYETRFDRRVSERSLVKLMTDGILLAELGRDHLLTGYDTIIIDEAHERSLNIDFLLGWLRRILPQRPDLKVIVTSATLDPERLSRHFGNAPIVEVFGRTYPVETHYRAPGDETDVERAIADAVDELWGRTPTGDVLVFLPGEREIRDTARVLGGRFANAEILPLYSRLAATAQDRVFTRSAKPRIVLATNVAETSLTVPGIRYVIDTGTARLSRYAPRTGVQQLQIEPVSQAAANQRAGRCGRLGPGVCIRLYAEEDFAARPAFTDPEIKRANLAGVILQMAALGLGRVDEFPWVDAPDGRHVAEAQRVLQTLGAFDDAGTLTPLGRELARLPLDPRIARIALAGRGSVAEEAVFVLAAALSVQDPHEVPADAQDAARQKHAAWRHKRSDFLSLLLLWQRWQDWSRDASNRQLRRLCHDHFVSFLRMEEWEAVYRQIADLLGGSEHASAGAPLRRDRAITQGPEESRLRGAPTSPRALERRAWTVESLEALYAPIHQALLTGLVDHIGQKVPDAPEYQGPKGRRFRLHPGSSLAKKAPAWVMSAQLAQTTRLYARTNAAIEPDWLEKVGGHLVKRTLLHPTWNPERGEVTATEHISLLGLPLASRPRHYGSTHPREAREIFIREALVGGRIPKKPAFLEHNLSVIDAIRDKETRLRRPDLLADDAHFFGWYDARLPADVCTTAALKRHLQQLHATRQGVSLTMQEADALRPGASTDITDLFPDHVDVGGLRIAVSYHHDPGAEHDGVTFHVPLAQAHVLPQTRFDWLVPGLLTDKIEALIRTLPNRLRRSFTPAGEFARAAAARLQIGDGDLLDNLCTSLTAMTGVPVGAGDFDAERIDGYLKPRFQIENDSGAIVGVGDSLDALQRRFAGAAREALNAAAAEDDVLKRWRREHVTDWDFDDLPEHVRLAGGGFAFPALDARDGHVELRLFESADAATAAHRRGERALLLLRMPDRLRDLAKSARGKLGLLVPVFQLDVDSVAREIAGRSIDAVMLTNPLRARAAFQAALEKRGAFSIDAQQRLDDVVRWLTRARELRARIKAAGGRWPPSLTDMQTQLDTLFAPGFVAAIPDPQWSRVNLYLRAIDVRLERLPNKPARDEDLTREVAPLQAALPDPFHAARWLLEEWRIALFAQELRAQSTPSAARIRALLAEGGAAA